MPKILPVVGCKNAGKTRTCELLVRELIHNGLAVGTLKYTEHDGFDWDVEGKDPYRHRQAGSMITGIFGRRCYAFSDLRSEARPIPISRLVATFYTGMDIVLIEGYRVDDAMKIEVLRPDYTNRPIVEPARILATYGERIYTYDRPHFAYGAENDLARYITENLDRLRWIADGPIVGDECL